MSRDKRQLVIYTPLIELAVDKNDVILKGRITRIWEAMNKNTRISSGFNFILLDDQNTHVHGFCRKNDALRLRKLMQEGKIHILSNVKIVSPSKEYKPVSSAVSIHLCYRTNIKVLDEDDHSIEANRFEFVPYLEIESKTDSKEFLIDVIGVVDEIYGIDSIEKNGIKLQFRSLTMHDQENNIIAITLWDELAYALDDKLKLHNQSSMVFIVTGLLVSRFKVKGLTSLTSTYATKVYINLNENKEVVETQSSIEVPTQCQIFENGTRSLHSQVKYEIENGTIEDIKEVKDLVIDEDKHFQCKAEIIGIEELSGWKYPSHADCNHKLKEINGALWCNRHKKEINFVEERYKVTLQVTDGTGITTFVLFHHDTLRLLKIAPSDLANTLGLDAKNDEIPPAITRLIGRTMLFHIKVTEYNTSNFIEDYTVVRIVNDNVEVEKKKELLLTYSQEDKLVVSESNEGDDSQRLEFTQDLSTPGSSSTNSGKKKVFDNSPVGILDSSVFNTPSPAVCKTRSHSALNVESPVPNLNKKIKTEKK